MYLVKGVSGTSMHILGFFMHAVDIPAYQCFDICTENDTSARTFKKKKNYSRAGAT